MEPPKKNSNWKQETFDAKLEELWAAKAPQAPEDLAAGEVVKALVMDQQGAKTVLYGGAEVVSWLIKEGAFGFDQPVTLVGINLLHSLRQCGWGAIRGGHTVTPAYLWNPPSGVFDKQVILLDPYSLSGAKGAGISVSKWLTEWGLEVSDDLGKIVLVTKQAIERCGIAAAE